MKFKVINQVENPLLDRREYTVEISDVKATPKRVEVLKQFTAKQGIDNKTTIIDTIKTSAGSQSPVVTIKFYNDEKTLRRVEVKGNVDKWEKMQEILNPKAPEPKKEEAPAQTPAEEKKEE